MQSWKNRRDDLLVSKSNPGNRWRFLVVAALLLITLLSMLSFSIDPGDDVPYPDGYRSWIHVKSKVALPKPGGNNPFGMYHHIYANVKALEGYKTGSFPDGAVIVSDFIAAIDSNASLSEGPRQYVDVMVRDKNKYATTGGWGFEEFDKDSKTLRRVTLVNAEKACFNCHKARAGNDFVFSSYRD